MEGKYTKIGVLIGLIALLISIIQILPQKEKGINGEWKMISKIKKAELSKYVGMEVEWKMYMTENNGIIKGSAEKIKINNISLDYNLRTSMKIEGSIINDKVTLNYIEYGKQRETSGLMRFKITNNYFEGIFSQTASNTEGNISGIKTH